MLSRINSKVPAQCLALRSVLSAAKTQRTSCITVLLFWSVVGAASAVMVIASMHIWDTHARLRRASPPPRARRPLRLHEMESRRGVRGFIVNLQALFVGIGCDT